MTINSLPMSCPNHPSFILEPKELHSKPYKCNGCKMKGLGSRYGCPKCDYELHNECKFPSYKISVPHLLKDHVFEFKDRPQLTDTQEGPWCDACGKLVTGFHYRCEKKNLDLHPCCLMLKERIEICGVEFRLNWKKTKKKCDLCDSKRVDGGDEEFPGGRYVSSQGHNCHVFCIMNWAVEHWQSSSNEINIKGDCYQGLALEKLETLPIVKKKKNNGANGITYWNILKILVTTILSVVFGDPTTILAKFAVEAAVQFFNY